MPASAISLAHFARSALTKAAKSSGGPAIDSNICGSRKRSRKAGPLKIRITSLSIFITTALGVPAGAKKPNHAVAWYPASPPSQIVRTAETRHALGGAEAEHLNLPGTVGRQSQSDAYNHGVD